MTHKFSTGCLWEGGGFEIAIDCEVNESSGDICKHCHSKETKVHKRHNGTTWDEIVWRCPKVVIAYNEGGHNSTGVCLDCIIEANNKIDNL